MGTSNHISGIMSAVDFLFTPTVQRVLGSTLVHPDQSFTLQELLRAADLAMSDDRLLCSGALRWRQSDLCRLVPDGGRRPKSGKGGDRQVGSAGARIAVMASRVGD